MSDVFLYLCITICIAVVVWGVSKIIQINKKYKRDLKRIDEWYQSQLEWLEEKREKREEREDGEA